MRGDSKSRFAFLVCVVLTLFQFNEAFAQKTAAIPARDDNRSHATLIPPGESWIPDDIDRAVPSVAAGATCSLPDVLTRAGHRVEEFVENVDRFTATEVLLHQSIDRSGRKRRPTTLRFDYLVSISKARDGFFQVAEFRNRSLSLDLFPSHIATTGTSSLAPDLSPALHWRL